MTFAYATSFVIVLLVLAFAGKHQFFRRGKRTHCDALGSVGDVLIGFTVFSLVGPGIGILTLPWVISLTELSWNNPLSPALGFFVPFAYAFGLCPAMITGSVAGLLRPKLTRWRNLLGVGLAGAVISSCWAWLAFPHRPSTSALGEFAAVIELFGVPGFVAALLCARLIVARER